MFAFEMTILIYLSLIKIDCCLVCRLAFDLQDIHIFFSSTTWTGWLVYEPEPSGRPAGHRRDELRLAIDIVVFGTALSFGLTFGKCFGMFVYLLKRRHSILFFS